MIIGAQYLDDQHISTATQNKWLISWLLLSTLSLSHRDAETYLTVKWPISKWIDEDQSEDIKDPQRAGIICKMLDVLGLIPSYILDGDRLHYKDRPMVDTMFGWNKEFLKESCI